MSDEPDYIVPIMLLIIFLMGMELNSFPDRPEPKCHIETRIENGKEQRYIVYE